MKKDTLMSTARRALYSDLLRDHEELKARESVKWYVDSFFQSTRTQEAGDEARERACFCCRRHHDAYVNLPEDLKPLAMWWQSTAKPNTQNQHMKTLKKCPVKICKNKFNRHPLCGDHWALVDDIVKQVLRSPEHPANMQGGVISFEKWKANMDDVIRQLDEWEAKKYRYNRDFYKDKDGDNSPFCDEQICAVCTTSNGYFVCPKCFMASPMPIVFKEGDAPPMEKAILTDSREAVGLDLGRSVFVTKDQCVMCRDGAEDTNALCEECGTTGVCTAECCKDLGQADAWTKEYDVDFSGKVMPEAENPTLSGIDRPRFELTPDTLSAVELARAYTSKSRRPEISLLQFVDRRSSKKEDE